MPAKIPFSVKNRGNLFLIWAEESYWGREDKVLERLLNSPPAMMPVWGLLGRTDHLLAFFHS